MNLVELAGATTYAFTLGLVAAVNPCGFPLLPSYLALFAGTPDRRRPDRIAGGLISGIGVTFGFVALFGTVGVVLETGVSLANGWLPWVMIAAGALMAGIGIATLCGHPVYLTLPVPRLAPGGRTFAATVLFGIAYAIGSLSCALPLFLAAVGESFTRLGFAAGMACYLAYALGMGLFVTGAAVAIATAGPGSLRRFRKAGAALPMVSGVVLCASGAYLAYYWAADLLNASSLTAAIRAVNAVQTGITSFITGNIVPVTTVLGIGVLAGIGAVIHKTWTAPGPPPNPTSTESTQND
jgi:cytochrome c biogenesis protein CcdA